MGEHATRFTQGQDEWVDVCELCTDEAHERGWARERSPNPPEVAYSERAGRRRFLPRLGFLEGSRTDPASEMSDPILRRLSPSEHAIVEAAELFAASPYRRTVAGIARSLGDPRVSLVPLSGTHPEVVITVAWKISWYQYRVTFDSAQSARLAGRGYELEELADRFKAWNAFLEADGRITPDIPRL